MLSSYDVSCLGQYPEYKTVFENEDVLRVLAWQNELCLEHRRHIFPSSFLEYEARIGTWNGTRFSPRLTESQFKQLEQLFAQSKWCKRISTDTKLTQDMYYQHAQWKEGTCRTRIQYDGDVQRREHIWKRKLISTLVEARTPGSATSVPLAIRIDLNQEIPIVVDDVAAEGLPHISLAETQHVKVERARFKWTNTYEYTSPDTGLVWHYHFNRVLEGKTKSEAEQQFRQLARSTIYECECECMNFLTIFEPKFYQHVQMTPIVYLFESFLVKLNDWIKLFVPNVYVYVCVQNRLMLVRVDELYGKFKNG